MKIHYSTTNWFTSLFPMPQAMKIPAAKAAVDKEWEKLEKISAWNLTKVKSKKQVIEEARTSGATVHFASLMGIIMKTILQEKVKIHYSTTIWFTSLFLCLKL